jgi:GntR family transcriptional regulator, arabinose operon transcriptional repressor
MSAETKEYVYNQLLARIVAGEFKPGDKLPTERELAKEYQISLWSVHNAMNDLEDNDFIERRRAVGTFVKSNISMEKVRRHKKSDSREIHIIVSPDFFFTKLGNDSILTSLESSLEAEKYDITYIDMPNVRSKLKKLLSQLQNGSIRALVIIPEYTEWKFMYDNIDLLPSCAGDIFYFNRGLGESTIFPMNCICVNPLQDSRTAASYLLEKGFRDINYIGVQSEGSHNWLSERLKGFRNIISNKSPEFSSREFILESFGERKFKSVCDHIATSESHPAFICCTDMIAGYVIDSASEHGYKPSKDYSIMGFDNHPRCRKHNLTTVAPPLEEVGPVVAKAIKERENWQEHDITHIYTLKSYIIERKTLRSGTSAG